MFIQPTGFEHLLSAGHWDGFSGEEDTVMPSTTESLMLEEDCKWLLLCIVSISIGVWKGMSLTKVWGIMDGLS